VTLESAAAFILALPAGALKRIPVSDDYKPRYYAQRLRLLLPKRTAKLVCDGRQIIVKRY
jgi:hypothetical protein